MKDTHTQSVLIQKIFKTCAQIYVISIIADTETNPLACLIIADAPHILEPRLENLNILC